MFTYDTPKMLGRGSLSLSLSLSPYSQQNETKRFFFFFSKILIFDRGDRIRIWKIVQIGTNRTNIKWFISIGTSFSNPISSPKNNIFEKKKKWVSCKYGETHGRTLRGCHRWIRTSLFFLQEFGDFVSYRKKRRRNSTDHYFLVASVLG